MGDVTTFFNSIRSGDTDTVRRLLQANPELGERHDSNDLTPVMFARYFGQDDVLRVLLQEGVQLSFHEAAAIGNLQRISLLLLNQPELLNSFSPDGFTALQLACYFNEPEVVELLLERGADVSEVSVNQMRLQALHSAAAAGDQSGAVQICEQLLSAGADVNARQHGGYTALHSAAQNGNEALARLLIGSGADRQAVTEQGKSAADFAREAGHHGLGALL
jgi:uncharacterized protein